MNFSVVLLFFCRVAALFYAGSQKMLPRNGQQNRDCKQPASKDDILWPFCVHLKVNPIKIKFI